MALLCFCDELLGQLLDYFDKHNLWKDTTLIVGTDHGFLLGEHDWWAKNRMPLYEEISHIPLFLYHPDFSNTHNMRVKSLTQTIDLMPTILELYNVSIPKEVEGKSLLNFLKKDQTKRSAGIFGYWGGGINVTDGRYTYFCYPKNMQNQDLYQYTLMPTHMTKLFTVDELKSVSLAGPFNFTKELTLLRVAHKSKVGSKTHSFHFPEKMEDTKSVIFDVSNDPSQTKPILDKKVLERLNKAMINIMQNNDAPKETILRMLESIQNS